MQEIGQTIEVNVKRVKAILESNARFEEMQTLASGFDRAVQDLILGSMAQFGIASTVVSELQLMTNRVGALQNQAEAFDIDEDRLDSLAKLVFQEIRNLLKLTRNLGREARAQTEYLARISETVANANGLISSAMMTADAAQMFYLLLFLSKDGDALTKYKVLAACGQMRAGLASIIVNLRQKEGSYEISRRIEELANRVFERLNVIREAADAIPNKATVEKKTVSGGVDLIIHKRNAANLVVRRQRELEDAEEEVKRLNREAAKRYH
jgi:hypothetical protein